MRGAGGEVDVVRQEVVKRTRWLSEKQGLLIPSVM